jgi:hypothetical protein
MRILERLSGGQAVLVSACLAVLLSLPSLKMGYLLDDLLHLSVLEGLPAPATPGDLFTSPAATRRRPALSSSGGPTPGGPCPR